MLLKCLKWGCLGVAVVAPLGAAYVGFNAPAEEKSMPATGQVSLLGGLKGIHLARKGDLDYLLSSVSAREAYPSFGSFLTTSLFTYYELDGVKFDCHLNDVGGVVFRSAKGELDHAMERLRLLGPVTIVAGAAAWEVESDKVTIDLKSGNVETGNLRLKHQSGSVAGKQSMRWQIASSEVVTPGNIETVGLNSHKIIEQ